MDYFKSFEIKNKRPFRVLHIGNIANNAYVNAKIMRRRNIEADVMSPDAYFVHTCPEWEEVDINEKTVLDTNFPDWSKVDLKGFRRPEWFFQGPRETCVDYFMLKNKYKFLFKINFIAKLIISLFNISKYLNKILKSTSFGKFIYFVNIILRCFILLFTNPILLFKKIFFKKKPILEILLLSKSNTVKTECDQSEELDNTECDQSEQLDNYVKVFSKRKIWQYILQYIQMIQCFAEKGYFKKPLSKPNTLEKEYTEAEQFDNYVKAFSKRKSWQYILQYYDIIQCYAEEGYWLYLSNHNNYVSYEHGTIREIPFKKTPQGKRCKLTYINAKTVFVTNIDCLKSAEILNINKSLVYPMPHAVDSSRYKDLRNKSRRKDYQTNSPIFIAPARHHWKNDDGDLSWVKGNDIIVKAAALSKSKNIKYKIKFVEWGKEVDLTKNLIEELNVEEYFEWVNLMPRKKLLEEYIASTGVIDQFRMQAIGSTSVDALALGVPLLTNIDTKSFKNFFGSVSPILNVNDPNSLHKKICFVIKNRKEMIELKAKSIKWFDKYHSSDKILEIHAEAFSKIIKV